MGKALPCTVCGIVTEEEGFVCARCKAEKEQKVSRAPEDETDPRITASLEQPKAAPAEQKKKKILIIDDEVSFASILAEALRASQYDVVTAKDGKEGLQTLLEEKPDVVILDILMPEVTGFEMVQHLKKVSDEEAKKTPIIILTAREDMEAFFSRSDYDAFLSKPIDPAELLKTIEGILGQ